MLADNIFPRRLWYAVAWADELSEMTPFVRTVIDVPILCWRTSTGAIAVLRDACPHRYAPLSLGQIDGEGVRCSYHGLKFSESGACIANPHGPATSALNVRAYTAVERHGLIWVWMGDQASADPVIIPDLSFLDRAPITARSRGYLSTEANHLLLIDNILDLSHADYLHADLLGGGSLTRAKPRIEEHPDSSVFVEWLVSNEAAAPIWRTELAASDTMVDMWTSVTWIPSGVMILVAGATPTGQPRAAGVNTENVHIITPETQYKSHYLFANTRDYRIHDSAYNEFVVEATRSLFSEQDKPMIEAQQRRIGDADIMDLTPKLLRIDQASTRARRIYRKILDSEILNHQAFKRTPARS